MQCFILSQDLMFSSQVSGAAKAAGLDAKTIGNASQISSDRPHVIVVDLTLAGLDIAAVTSSADARVVAVGPHVHEGKLNAAAEAGCRVLSKGQASRELASVLGELVVEG